MLSQLMLSSISLALLRSPLELFLNVRYYVRSLHVSDTRRAWGSIFEQKLVRPVLPAMCTSGTAKGKCGPPAIISTQYGGTKDYYVC